MLSGRFTLQNAEISSKYFEGKVQSILIPMAIYMALRTFYINMREPYQNGILSAFAQNLLGNLASTEYWFLYTLIGCLALAPVFALPLQIWKRKQHAYFILLFCLYGTVTLLTQILKVPFGYKLIFFDWSFYFYLGYGIEKIIDDSKPVLWLLTGACALVITTILVHFGVTQYVHDISPVFTCLTVSVYFLLEHFAEYVPVKFRGVISFLAQHSFGVYMCHMMVLEVVREHMQLSNGIASIISHIQLTFITLMVSLFISVVLDKTIVSIMKKGLTKIFDYCSKLKGKLK